MGRQNVALLAAMWLLASVAHAQESRPERGGCITECAQRFGILAAFGAEADILLADAVRAKQYVINANTFTIGVLRGNAVVVVLIGVSMENEGMVTQLMIDHFNVNHLLLSGIAWGHRSYPAKQPYRRRRHSGQVDFPAGGLLEW